MKANKCSSCAYLQCLYCTEIEKSIEDLRKVGGAKQDEVNVQIAKMQEDKQLVFGWANVCKTAEGSIPLDWAGDVIDIDDLEPSAYGHVLKFRAMGENHRGQAQGVLVESMVFTKEKLKALGLAENATNLGWWVGYYVPDKKVFEKCKSGEYSMLSIQGDGVREPLE